MSFLPLARVTGAAPAYALRPRASAKQSGVVADLGQQTCRGQLAQPREAGEDGHLWMLLKDESSCLGEVIGRLCGGLELFEQGQRLAAHRLVNYG